MEKKRILLLVGGWSRERDVSLASGQAVFRALDKARYDVEQCDPREDLGRIVSRRGRVDLALSVLHGKYGEDGRIQGLLDILGIPYVGSGLLSSALAHNKKMTKEIYAKAGLPTAADVILRRGESGAGERVMERVGLPAVVKPVSEGSSVGMSLCPSEESLLDGIERAFEYDTEVMVETYIRGREVTCCVMGNKSLETLPIIEIVPQAPHPFFDYEAKYIPGAAREICPAPVSEAVAEKVVDYAKRAHMALDCRVWSRTDMILRNDGLVVLETNTLPGMTENSLFPLAAKAGGMTFSELLDRLIALALEPS
jgi:D-alanine-D-alanine ligase